MHRHRSLLVAFAIALTPLVAPQPVAAVQSLPDLGLAPLRDFHIDNSGGRRLLRFTTVIVNVGAGPFQVHGSRSSTSETTMSGTQCVWDGATCVDVATSGVTMQWSGDNHNHWHVVGLQEYRLIRLDNGVRVGTGAKTGFCFYDNTVYDLGLAGAPQSAVYTGCGTQSALSVTMGQSVGWGDTYYWTLAYQWIDITNLAAGRYRLEVEADPSRRFTEVTHDNNTAWAILQIKGKGSAFRVIEIGPGA